MNNSGRLIILLLICCISTADGQIFKKRQAKKLATTSDSSAIEVNELDFASIQKPAYDALVYYHNQKALDEIERLDREENWEELYPILRDYVNNFGMRNFAYQTYLVWRLAKLTEVLVSEEASKSFYRIVLKHHREGLDIATITKRYEEINGTSAADYVPLEFYYELVEFRKQVDTLRPARGVLMSMGRVINSKDDDYAPSIATNDSTLLFTSKRNSRSDGFDKIINEDIFIATKERYWTKAEAMGMINTKYNEGSATMTKDGKTLYFSRCGSPDGFGNCDLYFSHYQGDTAWSEPENMGGWINSDGWDSHPTLSHTEDTLYFSSDRGDGFGLADIYYTYKNSREQWIIPQNLGPIINTRGNEVSPFFHPEHEVLYFSSNGQILNFGDYDIYKSNKMDKNKWSEPVNIGPLVNGPGTEFYFSIDRESKDIYYSRSKEESMVDLDLYSFPLPMGGQPLATTRFSGVLTDDEGNPMKGIVAVIDLDDGVEVAPKFLRADGTFDFDLINEKNYLLVIQGNDFFRIEELFFLDGDTDFEGTTERVSSKIEFSSIEFENGKGEILAEMEPDLNNLVNFLLDNPNFKINISGHTDSSGSAEINLALSQKRADAIKDYIVLRGGVGGDRITAIGYGSQQPIVINEVTADDKRLNRRVEFEIYRDDSEYDELLKMLNLSLDSTKKKGKGN
jgi:outer membrane protein OmpA-like peptidoglycan-associated protein